MSLYHGRSFSNVFAFGAVVLVGMQLRAFYCGIIGEESMVVYARVFCRMYMYICTMVMYVADPVGLSLSLYLTFTRKCTQIRVTRLDYLLRQSASKKNQG